MNNSVSKKGRKKRDFLRSRKKSRRRSRTPGKFCIKISSKLKFVCVSFIELDDGTQVEELTPRKNSANRKSRRSNPLENSSMLNPMRQFCLQTNKVGIQGLLRQFNELKGVTAANNKFLTKNHFDANPEKNRYRGEKLLFH